MFHKALWLKEYKQSKFLLWGFLIVSFYFPFRLYQEVMFLKQFLKYNAVEAYSNDPFTLPIELQFILVLLMASFMVGWERTNQNMDFSLSLPYSRKDIFKTKWALGASTIFSAVTANILISFYIVHHTVLSNVNRVRDYTLFYDYFTVLIVLIALFTFTLLIGYLTGSFGAQFVLSFIFSVLPVGLYTLVKRFLDIHWFFNRSNAFYQSNPFFLYSEQAQAAMNHLTLPVYLTNIISVARTDNQFIVFLYLLIPIVATIICFFLALKLSKKPMTEYNGMILLYQSFQPYFKIGVIVCFFLFGGMFVAGINDNGTQPPFIPYYIGAILFSGAAYFVLSKIMNKRISFRKR